MRYLKAVICLIGALVYANVAFAQSSVTIESKSAPVGSTIHVGISINNPLALRALEIPLVLRSQTGGAHITSLTMQRTPGGRLVGLLTDLSLMLTYPIEDGICKQSQPGGFGTQGALDFVSPDGMLFSLGKVVGPDLPPGSDGPGGSLELVMTVNNSPGTFEVDTTCANPTSHLAFVRSNGTVEVPVFAKGIITVTANLIPVTVLTTPSGLTITVDGSDYSSPQTFNWASGSSHTIATSSPQSGGSGTRYVWSNWNDGGAMSHTVSPNTTRTYVAVFATQFYLTTQSSPPAAGVVAPASGWLPSGASGPFVQATANPGYGFTNWSGSGPGSYSGTNNPATVTMFGPITQIANFEPVFCFGAAQNYAAGINSRSVYPADLDGDGDRDLAVANLLSGNVSVLMNNGDGTFAGPVQYVVGGGPEMVIAADLDGDGDRDLAVLWAGISILKNNGNGTFAAEIVYGAGTQPNAMCAADVDSDGDLDLAVCNLGSDNISVLNNNGSGTYAAPVNYLAGTDPVSLFAADLDGDNDVDLAVANSANNNVSVLKNNGNGVFAAPVNYAADWVPRSVFAADLDGDNDADLAVANASSNNVSVLANNGSGVYAAPINYAAGTSPYSVFAADLDSDGDQDLAVANNGSNNLSLLMNNNWIGTFEAAVNFATGTSPRSVFAADLDGNGNPDLAVANSASNNVSVLLSCGAVLCFCPMQGDITGDVVIDVFDVIGIIGIAFSGDPDPQDPACPKTRGDVDNNGVTDVFDVIYLIATAFSGGPDPVDPCTP